LNGTKKQLQEKRNRRGDQKTAFKEDFGQKKWENGLKPLRVVQRGKIPVCRRADLRMLEGGKAQREKKTWEKKRKRRYLPKLGCKEKPRMRDGTRGEGERGQPKNTKKPNFARKSGGRVEDGRAKAKKKTKNVKRRSHTVRKKKHMEKKRTGGWGIWGEKDRPAGV